MTKQRVLIVNKFYYPRGGDCVCTLNLEKLLGEHGHEAAVYAMDYPDNMGHGGWGGWGLSGGDTGGGGAGAPRG